QRVSPETVEKATGAARRSPQMEHTLSSMGWITDKHGSQTGKREMLARGLPQRRQSEGNKVANRADATPFTLEIKEESSRHSRVASLASVARVGFPLLLKTTLPRPAAASGAPAERIFFSITMAG